MKAALERGMSVQDVFTEALGKHAEERISFSDFNKKADADGWMGLLSAFNENQNKVFKEKFIETWANNDGAWATLKAQIERAFRSRGEADVYAHLDKVNKRLWIDKVEEVLELGADSNGDLRWTDKLKAWWRNPSNTVADFAKALAETSGITKVDFTGLFEEAFDPSSMEPASLAFISNPDIHRYWDVNALAALARCSGMTFRLVVLKSHVEDLQKIVKDLRDEFFDDCKDENISEDKCCWDIKMKKDKCFGVKDNGEDRLLWNATARELLLAAFGMDADGLKKLDEDRNPIVLTDLEKKNALETFAQAVLDAKGSREHIDGIDFAVPAATDVALFDVVRWSVQDKELWIVLKEKFGDKDGFKFFVRKDDIDNVEIEPGKEKGVGFFLKELGWKVDYSDVSKVFKITVLNHGAALGGETGGGEPGDDGSGLSGLSGDPLGATFSDEDLNKFFGKTKAEIDLDKCVDVVTAQVRALIKKNDEHDKFIAAVSGIGIKELGLDAWKAVTNVNRSKLKALVKLVFRYCPQIECISVKEEEIIKGDDPDLTISKCTDAGKGTYYVIKRKH